MAPKPHSTYGPKKLLMVRLSLPLLVVLFVVSSAAAQESWSTYRGNAQRTGNTDGKPGPDKPGVAWIHKSKDHYVAAPVVESDRLFVSGLGAFNLPTFACLSNVARPPQRVLWSKAAPSLKLPTVSSPALSAGRLIFGDGMHQTDGAILHCIEHDSGFPLWNYAVPGALVHLEGSPTVVGDLVYIGGGAAGVLCVDSGKLTLDKMPLDAAAIKKVMHKRWEELLAKYEEEKKANPDFAVPPSEDQLPKPMPTLVWQKGRGWHVDAPVAVDKGKVFVASAFLDKEKVGDRALFCLDAANGNLVWKKPLRLNPWGGPSIQGDIVVVSGSSIGYDPAKLKGAKGFIAAFKIDTGDELWNKEVPGGVLSCAALADGAAIVTASDGKVRAFDLANGERRWIYDARAPIFAPVAVARDRVFAGDLKGVVHAIDLKAGAGRWMFDLGKEADVQAPGMIYGGPVVQGGRITVATCNLEGPHARQETVVISIGEASK